MDIRAYDGDTAGMNLTNELPEYYWNVKSQEQRIYLICCKIEELYKRLDSEDDRISGLESDMSALKVELKDAIKECKQLIEEEQEKVDAQIEALSKELGDAYKNIEDEFELFKQHGFDLYYKKQVLIWIDQHLTDIWQNITARVFFNLTDDGYFCAYVPEQWSDLQFSTGDVYGQADYGCLILSYE